MHTVCILYGFCEGPRVSGRFRQQLLQAGYDVIQNPAEADIIIGHSGGCFLLPEKIRAKHIMLIGPVYWPGRGVLSSLLRKLTSDLRNHHAKGAFGFWARKSFWNLVYFWNLPGTLRMLAGRRRGYQWQHGAITTVIRPELDSFCTPDLACLPFTGKPKFIHAAGQHDDCWREPEAYIAQLKNW